MDARGLPGIYINQQDVHALFQQSQWTWVKSSGPLAGISIKDFSFVSLSFGLSYFAQAFQLEFEVDRRTARPGILLMT